VLKYLNKTGSVGANKLLKIPELDPKHSRYRLLSDIALSLLVFDTCYTSHSRVCNETVEPTAEDIYIPTEGFPASPRSLKGGGITSN
jgi:hypothetical protein